MSSWKNEELVDGRPGLAKSIILPTCGCYYDKCYMCSYKTDCPKVTPQNIVDIFVSEIEDGIDKYKIFTSGSFFDKRELSQKQLIDIMNRVSDSGATELTVESRPEFIDEPTINDSLEALGGNVRLEVAIGLESANNDVLKYHINKGFTFEKYMGCVDVLTAHDVLVKTYLLLKPPFLTEYESLLDVIRSARLVEKVSDTISINPISIHKDSVVEQLWKRHKYRPPYLWSLVECLNEIKDLSSYVMSHPVAVGKERGIHNCGGCDRELMEQIERYNMGSRQTIDHSCACREEWEEELKKIF
ncbi:MAG TPA: archaeosine biosynthesis radical SAM protein RaSEA [Candidatus Methanofastidiosa archaeon]|nr:archaeosine biosynthesis radical SAM protein RaSEA [Candidatus Methanofastidiosa archaeon]HPR42018.1 archaeosine biosynthesis radical SAM protein RaSEA [Candidatus Methanofastidiosa archaeon]